MPISIRMLVGASAAAAICLVTEIAAQRPLPAVLVLEDYATVPVTGSPTGTGNTGSLARVNVMREEPGNSGRFFVNDLNGPLYLLDKKTKAFTTYLDFNGRDDHPGLFDKLPFVTGYANGFISFVFDPDYLRNGKFYTIHMEEPTVPGSLVPDAATVPGLNVAGYTPTPAVKTPGAIEREVVLIEWTDTNIKNATFEGTAREILRVEHNTRIHPMGDMIFNPSARPGSPDWRVMYIGCGDTGSGEQSTAMRQNPQRLDTLVGKILRIIPDLTAHTATSTLSENGRYRIPSDNPFSTVAGARKEIWAYGLRNPHRLSWDVDPATGTNNLIAASIGLHSWETVYLVRKGANYGYSAREGNEVLNPDNKTGPLPSVDEIPVRISDTVTNGMITPTYPVAQFDHTPNGGDAISGGFVYRGKRLPALVGKYVFGDITTGKIWYADYKEMIAADDKKPATLATLHPLQVQWHAASEATAAGRVYPTMFPVVLAAYTSRGGTDKDLPGTSTVSGPGRADIRFAADAAGELYILSKVDGVIRAVIGVTSLPAAPARN